VLHCALGERTGLVTFYGHMLSALGVVSERTQREWLRALTSTGPLGVVDPAGPPARTIVPGVAEGLLVGGTLSLVASLCGTPWELDTRGRILMLEDVDEEPPRIDRYLTQLLNSGTLQECAGIWLGDYLRCRPREHWPLFAGRNLMVEELFDELIAPLVVPTLHGLPVGHAKDVVTVPLGVRARLDADAGRLELLEAALV
jgi:muramoyltetrapeptide carboxypeptidase